MVKSKKSVQRNWVANEQVGFVTAGIFSIGKCSAWCEAHTTHGQNFVFLPSPFLVFLRLVSLALFFFFFLLFRFYLLVCLVSCSQWTARSVRLPEVQSHSVGQFYHQCSLFFLSGVLHYALTHQDKILLVYLHTRIRPRWLCPMQSLSANTIFPSLMSLWYSLFSCIISL